MAVLLAIVGHDMLHAVQRWLTYVMMAVFGVLTIGAVLSLRMDAAVGAGHFSWAAFLIQLSAAAGCQISATRCTSPTIRAICRRKRRLPR